MNSQDFFQEKKIRKNLNKKNAEANFYFKVNFIQLNWFNTKKNPLYI